MEKGDDDSSEPRLKREREGFVEREGLKVFVLPSPKKPSDFTMPPAVALLN